MKKVIFGVFILLFTVGATAQQDPQFSQNMHNRLYPNPGVAGSNNAVCATLLGRHQWMGFEGKPETYLLSVHGPLSKFNLPLGVGLTISQDKLGHQSAFGAKLAVAYRRSIGPGSLGIGIGAGIVSFQMQSFQAGDAIDDINLDQSIPQSSAKDLGSDFDLGIYYKIPEKLYVGFSSTHLNQADLQGTNFAFEMERHYYIMAGYEHELSQNLVLMPSVFIKSETSSAQVDINILLEYNNLIWGGISYRYQDAIAPMLGIKKDNVGNGTLKVGYSYDVTTSKLKTYSSGSHEIMLGYCFNIPDNTIIHKHKNPRFL